MNTVAGCAGYEMPELVVITGLLCRWGETKCYEKLLHAMSIKQPVYIQLARNELKSY